MKSNIKTILSCIITGVLSTSISVFAATSMMANQIEYRNGTVENALDDLYELGNNKNYSEEEKVIGTWTNGEPLYRKVIYVNRAITTSNNLDVSDLNIDQLVNGTIVSSDGNTDDGIILLSGTGTSSVGQQIFYHPATKLIRPISSSYNLYVYHIILEYTKATDTVTQ